MYDRQAHRRRGYQFIGLVSHIVEQQLFFAHGPHNDFFTEEAVEKLITSSEVHIDEKGIINIV